MGKYQLQILLYGVHRDTDNPFGQPFGHTIDSLRQETLRLRQIFEQQSTKNSTQPAGTTQTPPTAPAPDPPLGETTRIPSIDRNLTDEEISKIPRPMAIQILTKYANDQGVTPLNSFLQQLSMPQLKIQVRAARDRLITQTATIPCLYENYTTTSGSEQPSEQNNVSQQQI